MLANTARRAGVQVRGAAPPWALAAGCADFAVSVAWLAACLRSRGAACGVRRSAFQCLPHGMCCIVCTYVPGPWCCCHWRAAVVPWRLCGDLRPVRGAHRSCFVSLCCAPATCAHRPRGLSSASGYVPLRLVMLHVAWPIPRCGCACGRVTRRRLACARALTTGCGGVPTGLLHWRLLGPPRPDASGPRDCWVRAGAALWSRWMWCTQAPAHVRFAARAAQ